MFGGLLYASGNWVEAGRCEIDYTADWPEWLSDIVEGWHKLNPHKDISHEDAYLTYYSDAARENETSHTNRGFYATFKDKGRWIWKMTVYPFGNIVYVDSEMRDTETRDECEEDFFYSLDFYEQLEGLPGAEYYSVHIRFEEEWGPGNDYHLFERNCQHWAHYVITGKDESSKGGDS